jgi:Tol biopolymer transport system component
MLRAHSLLAIAVALLTTACGGDATGPDGVGHEPDYDLLYDAWSGITGEASELYRLDISHAGAAPVRILPGKPASGATASPDGTRIVYAAYVGEHLQLFAANIDGTGVTRLTENSVDDDEPAWSPDGTRIAFRRWDLTPDGESDIWVMNADGTDARNLTGDQGRTNQLGLAWSPRLADGSYRIVYTSQTNEPDGQAHLFTMAADGTDKRQITTGDVWDDEPAWSPDGATLAFVRYTRTGYAGLHLMDAAGGNERRLMPATLAFAQFAPAWSPDGKLIAFRSKHEGGIEQIYTVWVDGSKVARRTFDNLIKGDFAWIRRAE